MPLSTDELRLSLLRKLTAVLRLCHECPARACRRHRSCASPALECAKLPARRPRSPEQEQAALAYLKRAIARRRAEIEAGERK